MSFVTYILVIGFHMGQEKSFTPEILGKTGSSGLVMLVLEVLALKVGFYLLDGPRNSFLDFICWSGYKYVGITLCCIARVFAGQSLQMIILAITGISMSWFIVSFPRLCPSAFFARRLLDIGFFLVDRWIVWLEQMALEHEATPPHVRPRQRQNVDVLLCAPTPESCCRELAL